MPRVTSVTVFVATGFDAAHLHAHMLGFRHDHDAFGAERIFNCIGDFTGKPFLQLRAPCHGIDHTRKLGKPGQPAAVWQVGDMNLAEKWQKVMLAHGVKADIADDDEFTMANRP